MNGDGAEDVTALIGTGAFGWLGSVVSNLVMARPLGTFPEPLAFLFFDVGCPEGADGDV